MKILTRPQAVAAGLREFHVAKPCRRGHTLRTTTQNGCLECRRTAERKYYRDHRRTPQFAALRRSDERRRLRENPARWMLARARSRAKKFGIPFAIEKIDIVVPAYCPILGIPLRVGDGRSSGNSPSLDRIRPQRGYVKGNIAVISHRANQLKNDATVAELRALLVWLERQ